MKTKIILTSLLLIGCTIICTHSPTKDSNTILDRAGDSGESIEMIVANNRQYDASVWMGTINNTIYYFPRSKIGKPTNDDNCLCCINGENSEVILRFPGDCQIKIIALINANLYYSERSNEKTTLYWYNLNTSEKREIMSSSSFNNTLSVFAQDGSFYYPENGGPNPRYIHVENGKIVGIVDDPPGFSLGGREYSVFNRVLGSGSKVVRKEKNGIVEDIPLDYSDWCALIPTEYGLLIHNVGLKDVLSLVGESGETEPLFYVDCMASKTAVTVVDDYVFISVKRYEKYGAKGMIRYVNDSFEGTYRIDLRDKTVIKISDSIYDGLYYFDDIGLFASNESCQVFRLDYDGNQIEKIIN